MAGKRAHVVLPENLVREIDQLVGVRRRSAFLTELAEREIRRRRLLEVFKRQEPIWKDEDHPELQAGAAQWVREMRADGEKRFQATQRDSD